MKKMIQLLRNSRGLTLVELLAVVIILAIISTIAFVMITGVIDNAKKDAHIANAIQLISSAKLYEASGGEIDSSGVTSGDLHDDGFIEVLVDPWDTSVATYNGTVSASYKVTLSSNGKDCDIEEATVEELAKGRSEVCKES